MVIVEKVLGALAMPLGTALLAGVLAIVALAFHRRRMGMAIIAFSTIWLWFWSMPIVAKTVSMQLASDHYPERLAALPEADAIVLLSGDVRPVTERQPYPLLSFSGDRAWHAFRLWRSGKAPVIIVAGGRVWGGSEIRPAAAILSDFLKDLGVPESAIVREERSRNTRQNAEYSAELARRIGVEKVLLVTHTWHMRRAEQAFQRTGLEVFPASFDAGPKYTRRIMDLLPRAGALNGGMRSFHEYLGQLFYRLRSSISGSATNAEAS